MRRLAALLIMLLFSLWQSVGAQVPAPNESGVSMGHLHLNVLPRSPAEVEEARRRYVELAERAVSLGGTVSAEHGIGVAKVDWLERTKGADHVRALRAVKSALDPAGIMNPGVLLPRRVAPA